MNELESSASSSIIRNELYSRTSRGNSARFSRWEQQTSTGQPTITPSTLLHDYSSEDYNSSSSVTNDSDFQTDFFLSNRRKSSILSIRETNILTCDKVEMALAARDEKNNTFHHQQNVLFIHQMMEVLGQKEFRKIGKGRFIDKGANKLSPKTFPFCPFDDINIYKYSAIREKWHIPGAVDEKTMSFNITEFDLNSKNRFNLLNEFAVNQDEAKKLARMPPVTDHRLLIQAAKDIWSGKAMTDLEKMRRNARTHAVGKFEKGSKHPATIEEESIGDEEEVDLKVNIGEVTADEQAITSKLNLVDDDLEDWDLAICDKTKRKLKLRKYVPMKIYMGLGEDDVVAQDMLRKALAFDHDITSTIVAKNLAVRNTKPLPNIRMKKEDIAREKLTPTLTNPKSNIWFYQMKVENYSEKKPKSPDEKELEQLDGVNRICPFEVTCQYCQKKITTHTKARNGHYAWKQFKSHLFSRYVYRAPSQLLRKANKDVYHYCPRCRQLLGLYKMTGKERFSKK